MQEPPAKLKTTAIIQLVSGVLNIFVMPWLVGFVAATALSLGCGLLTILLGGVGAFCGVCGWAALLLIPIGIFEVVSGILGLANPASAGKVMRIASFVEMGSILLGGIFSLVAGIIAFILLRDPEVAGYIETASLQ